MMSSSTVSKKSLSQKLWVLGFSLFFISFFAPSRADTLQFFGGLFIFFETPVAAVDFAKANHYLFCIAALAAWSANFTIFIEWRVLAIWGIVSIWIAYACFFE